MFLATFILFYFTRADGFIVTKLEFEHSADDVPSGRRVRLVQL